jgi:hypothetical protein
MSTNGIRKNLVCSGGDSAFSFAQRPEMVIGFITELNTFGRNGKKQPVRHQEFSAITAGICG